ncbi:hypothetical protein QI036_09370 [Staphylococcus saprophyticus]|nr:hypothetical protein [Staphylococcus saprophyticus]
MFEEINWWTTLSANLYLWFFAISLIIALVVVLLIYFYNKKHPCLYTDRKNWSIFKKYIILFIVCIVFFCLGITGCSNKKVIDRHERIIEQMK